MQIETSTLMMFFFIVLLVLSIWKIYAFLPNEQLKDDDTTIEVQARLEKIMLDVIHSSKGNIKIEILFSTMKEHPEFDKKKYWRFNLNKLNHLLEAYYAKHLDVRSIEDIYRKMSK